MRTRPSYPDFVGNRTTSSKWFNKREVYSQLNSTKAPEVSYKLFMKSREIDQELADFYNKERLAPVLGSEQFLNTIPNITPHEEVCLVERVGGELKLEKIISLVSDTFSISKDHLLSSREGKGVNQSLRVLTHKEVCGGRGGSPEVATAYVPKYGESQPGHSACNLGQI